MRLRKQYKDKKEAQHKGPSYFFQTWGTHCYKWAACFRVFPHANADTNNLVESYHNNLKNNYIKKTGGLKARRMDWLIWSLTHVIHDVYYRGEKARDLGLDRRQITAIYKHSNSIIMKAKRIPDDHLRVDACGWKATCKSSTDEGVLYNLIATQATEWLSGGVCNCAHSRGGNVCKHHAKWLIQRHGDVRVFNHLAGRSVSPPGAPSAPHEADSALPGPHSDSSVGPQVSVALLEGTPQTHLCLV